MDGMIAGRLFEADRARVWTPGAWSDADATLREAGRMRPMVQHSLRNAIRCTGVGLHSGLPATLVLRPAPENSGIMFRRVDCGANIAARYDHVVDTRLCTVVAMADAPEVRVATVEHLMAALLACGIDNVVVELDGPEVPVLDGSSAPYVFLIDCAGRVAQTAPRPTLEILKPVRVEQAGGFAELRPSHAPGLSLSLSIEFAAGAIGRQAYTMRLSEQGFRDEIADCRTFTLRHEIEAMREAGLARGGSLENAVVVDGDAVVNPAGLRRPDEFVRHKMLDAIGDLALAGRPLRGAFIGHRSGHGLNNRLLRALMEDGSAWRLSSQAMPERTAA